MQLYINTNFGGFEMPEKLMIIDGNSIVNRAFYGVPLLSDSDGNYTNGCLLYTSLELINKCKSDI